MSKKNNRIVFTGGGTGGHIFPGLAVADELYRLSKEKNIDIEIFWIGNKKGMDSSIVEKNLIENGGCIKKFYGISCGKLRRYFSIKNFFDIFNIILGFFQAFFILTKLKAKCVFSKGGFVSVPPCFASKILRIPYFTHECDFTPGLATKLNSSGAKNIFISYEDSVKFFNSKFKSKCVVTGNPVRPIFYETNSDKAYEFLGINKNHEKPILLVLGGSLGALQINKLIIENLEWLKERFIVVHQMGKSFAEENPSVFDLCDENYKAFDFIFGELPSVLHCADIVLSRAGANSLWECAVTAKPLLLIPLCGAGTRGDQVDNAKYFENKKAAYTLLGEDVNSENLKIKLELMLNKTNREELSKSCKDLCGLNRPALKIAELIMEEI